MRKVQQYVYVLADDERPSRCKVGVTQNPHQRLKSHRSTTPRVFFYSLYEVPTRAFERKVISHLKDIFTVHSEYVTANPEIVSRIIEGLLEDVQHT